MNNSFYFNRPILNEELDINGMRVFYNKLIDKLISRYSANYNFSFAMIYDRLDTIQLKS